jgi:quinol monooxygenase YgiN
VLIIAGHYHVEAEQRGAYVAAFADLVRRARAAPGCLDVAITADLVDPRRVNNYERWESEDTLAAFRAVADPPEVDVEMVDMQVSKFHVDRESDPFD